MAPVDLLYMLVPFVIALFIGSPICAALSLGTLSFIFVTGLLPSDMITLQMFNAAASFPLMAVPFFIFAGDLMNETGISARLINLCKVLFQQFRGGLAYAIITTGTLFAGLTGSACAEAAALTKIMTPTMKKEGYAPEFTASLCASVGVLGPVIPPSIVFIVYGATVGTSVGALFMGGIIPGLLMAFGLMCVTRFLAGRHNFPQSPQSATRSEILAGFKDASLSLVMPILIIVGIRGGVFTPTEGGAVAATYAIIIGLFVYKTVTLKSIAIAGINSAITSAVIMLIVSSTVPFGWIITIGRVPALISEYVLSLTDSVFLILLGINILLIFMGMFMETLAIILLLAPMLVPIAAQIGLDPVHFGMIVCVNLCIGMITPPIGINLFVAAPVAGITMGQISRGVLPFLFALLVSLFLISLFPQITLWLPSLLQ